MVVSCLSLNSSLIIKAKGTGIRVYNVLYEGLDVNFTVDGRFPYWLAWSDPLCETPNPLAQGCYNFQVYNIQSLTHGPHKLQAAILTDGIDDGTYANPSNFWFDYAVVSTSNMSTQ
jgi:hypothetical protein